MVGYIETVFVDLNFVAKHNLTMKPTKALISVFFIIIIQIILILIIRVIKSKF
jgi:hypothetical protein